MDDTDRAILTEIRDLQREYLAEYRSAAARSIALQERAVARQEQISSLYRRVVIVAGALIAGGLAFLVYGFIR